MAPGELCRTGYPYIVKRLKRGQPLSAAVELFRGKPDDGGYGVVPYVARDSKGRTLSVIVRPLDTFNAETHIITAKGVQRVAIPAKANIVDLIDGRVIIQSQEAWTPAGRSSGFAAGSLFSVDLAALKANPAKPRPTLIYTRQIRSRCRRKRNQGPPDRVHPRQCSWTDLGVHAGAQGRLGPSTLELPTILPLGGRHQSNDDRALSVLPASSLRVAYIVDAATGSATKFRQQAPKFDASNLVAEQYEAVSSDGTKSLTPGPSPRYQARRKQSDPALRLWRLRGRQTPTYGAGTGKLWLERGGVYALANIRGGGEFGPAWHEAGLGTKRQIVYDDFAAVGRDLIKRNITSPRRLGIRGGSNGGLLTGVSFTQHPELWNAVIIDIPLLDMLRISKIAAGASWEGEYGSVEDPAVRAFWTRVSPYHALKKGTAYPVPFIYTTTRTIALGPSTPASSPREWRKWACPSISTKIPKAGTPRANLKQSARTQAWNMSI